MVRVAQLLPSDPIRRRRRLGDAAIQGRRRCGVAAKLPLLLPLSMAFTLPSSGHALRAGGQAGRQGKQTAAAAGVDRPSWASCLFTEQYQDNFFFLIRPLLVINGWHLTLHQTMWTQAKIPGANRAVPWPGQCLSPNFDPPLSPSFVKIVFLPPGRGWGRLASWQPHGRKGSNFKCGEERNKTKVIWGERKCVNLLKNLVVDDDT